MDTGVGKARFRTIVSLSLVSVLVLPLICLCIGAFPISLAEIPHIIIGSITASLPESEALTGKVLMEVRLPRICAALVCGAALSLAGSSFQGVFKNPLVSPEFLGVQAGACVGAALAILLALGSIMMETLAFAGGLLAVLLTTAIPKLLRSDSKIMLVLAGIIVSGLASSVFGFLKYVADPETQLASIVYWQMGSFSYVNLNLFLLLLPVMLVAAGVLLATSWRINVLSLGEREAQSLGIKVGRVRGIIMLCSTLLTAGAVCIAGTIGWVGLIVPHITRLAVGPQNTRLMPLSCLFGALFMLLVDTLTRTIGPVEMPVSILTGVVGAPLFAWFLYKERKTVT